MSAMDPEGVKDIVRNNFDRSVLPYDVFEEKYHLFGFLAKQLAEECGIRTGMTVCDIGCGLGTSTIVLSGMVGPVGKVIGLDFSKEMIGAAKKKFNYLLKTNMEFICCDAEQLEKHVETQVDAVLYNASIFLIPEPKNTLQVSYDLLKSGGVVGMNYLRGIFDNSNPPIDLFRQAKEEGKPYAPYGRPIIDTSTLPFILKDIGYQNVREGTITRPMTRQETKEFYSIPAQSAGLYPKTPYEKRINLLDALLDHIESKNLNQRWGWCVGYK